MNIKRTGQWVKLMTATLDDLNCNYTDNPRVRPAINTLLAYFPGSMLMNSNLTIVSVLETTTPMRQTYQPNEHDFVNMTPDDH